MAAHSVGTVQPPGIAGITLIRHQEGEVGPRWRPDCIGVEWERARQPITNEVKPV